MIKPKSFPSVAHLFSLLLIGLVFLIGCTQEGNQPQAEVENNSPSDSKDLQLDSIEIEGITRHFEYHTPHELKPTPALVFVLHGSNGTVADTRRFTNYEFEKIASERAEKIIVYPKGYDQHWNDCRMHASYKANREDVNDIAFFSEMIEYFNKKFQINKEAVFVTGISNGGHMCYKLAYELPDKIKGIAPFVANIPEAANNDCAQKNEAMSVLIINGTKDPINPHEGGWVVVAQDSSRGSVLSTDNTFAYWKNLAACDNEPQVIEYENIALRDSSTAIHYKYACKDTGKRVELLKIVNGGHTVPINDTIDIPARIKKIVGNKNRDINAPLIVLDFFDSLIEADT